MKVFLARSPVWPGGQGVYVHRPVDQALLRHLRQGTSCTVRGQRLSGKTSAAYCALRALETEGARWQRQDLSNRPNSTLLGAWQATGARILKGFGLQAATNSLDACATIAEVTEKLCTCLEVAPTSDGRFYVFLDEADNFVHRFPPDSVRDWLVSLRDHVQQGPSRVVWLLGALRPLAWFVEPDLAGLNLDFTHDIWVQPFPNDQDTWAQLHAQGFPDDDPTELFLLLKEVLDFTGGQAQLSSLIFSELQSLTDAAARRRRFEQLTAEAKGGGPTLFQGHLDGVAGQVLAEPGMTIQLLGIYERVLRGDKLGSAEAGGPASDYLVNMGLLRVQEGRFAVANEVYRARLQEIWVEELRSRHEIVRFRGSKRRRQTQHRRTVAVLTTGGTMGMITSGSRSTFEGARTVIESLGREALRPIAEVGRWEVLWELDGINVTPAEWSQLARWIHEQREHFDGFVICHGTDTLAWTASALAFMLGRSVDKPVVFTGSQATVSIEHGDMLDNLRRSCLVAVHPEAPREVLVQFGNAVFRAVRAEKADDRLYHGFRSPGWPELAQVSEELLVNRFALGGRPTSEQDSGFQPYLNPDVLVVPIVPGMHVRHFEALLPGGAANTHAAAIIVHTPGAGNIPSRDGYNYRDAIRRAVDGGVPVLVASQVQINPYTQAQYEASTAVTDYGAMLAGSMTLTAAHSKLAWVLGCVEHEGLVGSRRIDEIRKRMARNYQGEQAEAPSPAPPPASPPPQGAPHVVPA